MNPYSQFRDLLPTEILQGEVLVFYGTFRVPMISGFRHKLHAGALETVLKTQTA